MTQESLFYESFTEAINQVIRQGGGTKSIACKLWPEKTPEAAQRLLSDCLNDNRPEKLSPDQVLFLLRLGREINCHAAINYVARESGYSDPQPIEPEDEKARLQREFIEAQKAMTRLASQMEKVGILRAAA